MKTRGDAPWVVSHDNPFSIECLRCGSREVFILPMPIDRAVKRMRGFIRTHEECPDPVARLAERR